MTMKFEPLVQRTTPGSAYFVLREAILNDVRPGGQLREAHIAVDMGISRAPLREAFSMFIDDGLVAKIPYRRFHRTFCACSGSSLLVESWTTRESRPRSFLAADHEPFSDLRDVADEHEKRATRIWSGEIGDIRAELTRHIHSAPGCAIESANESTTASGA